jgi:hypothetical protein
LRISASSSRSSSPTAQRFYTEVAELVCLGQVRDADQFGDHSWSFR